MRRSNRASQADTMTAQLTELLALRRCWYEPFPFDRQLPRLERDRIVLPAAEPGIAPWRLDEGVELPVRFGNLTIGRLVLVGETDTCGVAFLGSIRDRLIDLATRLAESIAGELREQALSRRMSS
jgi:hypothetical protein